MLVKFNDSITIFGDEYRLEKSEKEWRFDACIETKVALTYHSGNLNTEVFSTNNKKLATIVYDKIIEGILKNESVAFNFSDNIRISDNELNILMNEIE